MAPLLDAALGTLTRAQCSIRGASMGQVSLSLMLQMWKLSLREAE